MNDRMQQLLDKQDITEALLRFVRGIDRIDKELILSAFHPDATDDHGPFKGSAADFTEWALMVLKTWKVSQHRISNIQIELHGDRANVETYLMALHVPETPQVEEIVFGRYLDLFERRNGEWKIAHRLVVIDYSSTRDRTATYSDEQKYTGAGRDKTDPVYTHKWD